MPKVQSPQAVPNLDALLQELTHIVQDGKPALGLQWIDEERFYVCMTKMMRSSPRLFGNPGHESCRLLDQIEKLVQHGKARIFGKVVIDTKSYRHLVAALSTAVRKEKDLTDTPQEDAQQHAQASEIIQEAHTQAQCILAQAQQEAQNIIEDTRRNANS